jgi:hypothetical protein
MMQWTNRPRRFAAAAFVAGLAVLLTGCLLAPGKFSASLVLRKGGGFTYKYDGEIHLLALSKLAQMGQAAESDAYVEETCYDDETFEERDCTDAEKAEHRQAWDDGAAARKAKKEQDAAAMRAMLGGIDPADPAAAEELAARLRRQVGWTRVDYKGDGLFDVSFSLTGKLDHDFLFPTFEGFPMANFFVTASRRVGGAVRVDAPGFGPQTGGNPFQSMMMAGMMGGAAGAADAAAAEAVANAEAAGDAVEAASDAATEDTGMAETMPNLPTVDGVFTITTDGEILANNTDEGATSGANGKTLVWTINVRTKQAPTALIKID